MGSRAGGLYGPTDRVDTSGLSDQERTARATEAYRQALATTANGRLGKKGQQMVRRRIAQQYGLGTDFQPLQDPDPVAASRDQILASDTLSTDEAFARLRRARTDFSVLPTMQAALPELRRRLAGGR